MSVINQGRPLFPIADRALYEDIWEWGGKLKDSLESFFNQNKVALSDNLVFNGEFETNIVGWKHDQGTGTLSHNTDHAFIGRGSLHMSRTAVPGTARMRISSRAIFLEGLKPYAISVAYKSDSPNEIGAGAFFQRLHSIRTEPPLADPFISQGAVSAAILFANEALRMPNSAVWALATHIVIPRTNTWVSVGLTNNSSAGAHIDSVEVRGLEFL